VSKRVHKLSCSIVIAIVFETLFFIAPCGAQQLGNDMLSVSVDTKDGTYRLAVPGGQPIFTSRVAAQVNHEWLRPTDYPHHAALESKFADDLGSGRAITVTNSGLPGKADVILVIQLYDQAPSAALQVSVQNTTEKTLTIQSVRAVELTGDAALNLGGHASADRVLSDSYSEDRPALRLSFAKTLQGHKSRPVTMLQARPHAIHFKRILDFGERHHSTIRSCGACRREGHANPSSSVRAARR
jgi:alpha-galactosidase